MVTESSGTTLRMRCWNCHRLLSLLKTPTSYFLPGATLRTPVEPSLELGT